jgi:hypothetical protein
MNGATIYATVANFSFTNSLALNGAILRVGGSNSRTLNWNGPVTATGNAGISADGGTTGVNIGGGLDITGATFTSTTNNNGNTINGPITGAGGNLIAQGTNGVLQLAGNNTYGGTTTIGDGSFLRLTATFTDTAGTLDVTSTSSILQLGTGAVLAFANSSGVSWTGGNLRINGAFVPGFSIRFGSNDGGLTSTQIALIRVNGSTGPFTLNSAGFLTTPVTDPYDLWKSQITNGQDGRTQDADGDGFTNQHEFLFGTSPIAGHGALVTSSVNGGGFLLRWMQRASGATYTVEQSPTLAAASWTTVVAPVPAADPDQAGVPAGYVRQLVTLPMTGGARFYRISASEN